MEPQQQQPWKVEPLSAKDIDAIVAHIKTLPPQDLRLRGFGNVASDEEIRTLVKRQFGMPGAMFAGVFDTTRSHLVAYATYGPDTQAGGAGGQDTAAVGLSISPQFRGQGIYRAVFDWLCDTLAAHYTYLSVDIRGDNERSIAAWNRVAGAIGSRLTVGFGGRAAIHLQDRLAVIAALTAFFIGLRELAAGVGTTTARL